jgi:hypothetical protein
MSRVLTGVAEIGEGSVAEQYLAALLADPRSARLLSSLWTKGGFARAPVPATVDDLAAEGVYDSVELAALADTIVDNWYSGIYATNDGARVATYVDALAWRTLGYRRNGPTVCGGGFGHWADRPTEG